MNADMATAEISKQEGRSISTRNFLGGAPIHFLESVAKSNSAMVSGSIDFARETCAFSQKRLQAYVDAWIAISKCKDLNELSERQVKLAKKATSQYMEEMAGIIKQHANVTASIPRRE
jgi:hypothetical protein